MKKNLISVGAIADTSHRILFSSQRCWVINNQGVAEASGHRDPSNGLYSFRQQTATLSLEHPVLIEIPPRSSTTLLWQRRLRHLSYPRLYHLSRTSNALGLPRIEVEKHICLCCMVGREHHERFPRKLEIRSNKPGERIHSDLMGPMQQTSLGGSRYALVFTDDYSLKGWVYFLKNKGETMTKFREFKQKIEGETMNKIQILRTDRGGEYLS